MKLLAFLFLSPALVLTTATEHYSWRYQSLFLVVMSLFTAVFAQGAFGASASQKKIVSSAHITVLKPQQTLHKVRAHRSKPLVVLFSSFDRRCSSCEKANRAFYQLSKQQKRFDYIFVNTMPWAAKELETSLHYRVNIRHPATMMFYQGKILKRVIGDDYSKMTSYLKEVTRIIATGNLALYGESLSGRSFNEVIISDRYRKFLDKYLASNRNYKALAVAFASRGTWTASQKVGFSSQQKANSQALKQCNDNWRAKGRSGSCKLYMVGNRYVHNKSG